MEALSPTAQSTSSSLLDLSANSVHIFGSPQHTSCPTRPQPSRPKHKPTLKVLAINFQSIEAKKESSWELIDRVKEKWLTSAKATSEVISRGYFMDRKDRPDGYGGVIIIYKDDLIGERVKLDTDT